MSIKVERISEATPELLESLNDLLPQLSSSAPALSQGDLARIVNSDVTTIFIAREGDRVVGSLTLAIFGIPTGLRAWIEDVVVHETSRGSGIGEALTNAAIDEARTRGVRSIDLTSRPSREAANALYQKLGFEPRDTNVYRLGL